MKKMIYIGHVQCKDGCLHVSFEGAQVKRLEEKVIPYVFEQKY